MDRREDLEAEIRERISHLLGEPGVESALLNVAYAVVASRHGAGKLTPDEDRLVRGNYPSSNDDLIVERALDETGVLTVVAMASTLARIAVDYSPLSNVEAKVEQDGNLPPQVAESLSRGLAAQTNEAIGLGMTRFGAYATVVLNSTYRAVAVDGLPWPVVVRVTLDALTVALESAAQGPPEEGGHEAAIGVVARQLGVSKGQARRIIRQSGVDLPPTRRGQRRRT